MKRSVSTMLTILAAWVCAGVPAHGEGQLERGRWRLELTHMRGVDIGARNREDDYCFTGSVEYEMPMSPHGTLGVRLYPAFVYHEEDSHPIYGGALGLAGRLYAKEEGHKGLFGEVGTAVLWHSRQFEGNTADVNFLTEVGIGYLFRNDLHVAVKYRHMSNAGTARKNAGVDSLGLGVGFTF